MKINKLFAEKIKECNDSNSVPFAAMHVFAELNRIKNVTYFPDSNYYVSNVTDWKLANATLERLQRRFNQNLTGVVEELTDANTFQFFYSMGNALCGKLYYFTEYFWKAYRKLSIDDLYVRDLLGLGSGCVQLPEDIVDADGDRANHIFFHCEKKGDVRCLWVAWLLNLDEIINDPDSYNGNMNADLVFMIREDELDKKFSEVSDRIKRVNSTGDIDLKILSLIAYINSGAPDIRVFKNSLAGGLGRNAAQIRKLSKSEINLVGYSWKKPRQTHVDGWEVEPYCARRWYGPGKKQWKIVPIKGSFRGFKKVIDREKYGL